MKTKRNYKLLIVLFLSVFFLGCNTDQNGYEAGGDIDISEKLPEGKFNAEITNLTATSEVHNVTIKWNSPQSEKKLGFYLIEWKGSVSDKTVYSKIVEKETTETQLEKLLNEEYSVTVKCVSTDLLYSDGVKISCSTIPDNTPPGVVSNLKVDPLAVSAIISWTSPNDSDLEKVNMEIVDLENNELIFSSAILSSYNSYQVTGLEEASQYKIKLIAEDYLGNKSTAVEQTFKTLTEKLVNKTPMWEIVDFSTEESSGEGSTGRAKDALDGNDATFWHSQWTSGGSQLPQWIIFDILQEVIPTELICYKRNNNNNGPTSVKIEGSLDGNIKGEWLDFGTFALSASDNNGQKCKLLNPKKVRYFRFTVLASPNNYAMVRNIEIKALIQE